MGSSGVSSSGLLLGFLDLGWGHETWSLRRDDGLFGRCWLLSFRGWCRRLGYLRFSWHLSCWRHARLWAFVRALFVDAGLEFRIRGGWRKARIPMRVLADARVLCPHDVVVARFALHSCVASRCVCTWQGTLVGRMRMDDLLEGGIARRGSQPWIPAWMLADAGVFCPHDVLVADVTRRCIFAALLRTQANFALKRIHRARGIRALVVPCKRILSTQCIGTCAYRQESKHRFLRLIKREDQGRNDWDSPGLSRCRVPGRQCTPVIPRAVSKSRAPSLATAH